MPYYKFKDNEVFVNTVKAYPSVKLLFYNGSAFLNDRAYISGSLDNPVEGTPRGSINLYEYNINRKSVDTVPTEMEGSFNQPDWTGIIFPWVVKDGTRIAFKTITNKAFNTTYSPGEVLTSEYYRSSSISKEYYSSTTPRHVGSVLGDQATEEVVDVTSSGSVSHLFALKQTLNYYTKTNFHYTVSSSILERDLMATGSPGNIAVGLLSVPSIFYGSSIKKGSVDLKFYVSGTLVGRLQDLNYNGELVETYGTRVSGVAGVVLYNEGFMVLTGAWSLDDAHQETYAGAADNPRWTYFAQNISSSGGHVQNLIPSSSFTMDFSGTTRTQTLNMFTHARPAELNHSNNPTFLAYTSGSSVKIGSKAMIENSDRDIKNIVSSSYTSPTGSFQKVTYLSKIGIYDDHNNLIGIANLATPVKKTEDRAMTFKLKLDI